MRVAFLNQFYAPDISPTAQLTASVAEHRAQQGDEVTVFASYGGYVPVAGEEKENLDKESPVSVRRVWTPRFGKKSKLTRVIDYACFYLTAAWKLLTCRRQDVIVTLTTPPFIACVALLHKMIHRKTKVVLWNMDCYPEVAERSGVMRKGGLLSRALRLVNKIIFHRIDHLVVLDTAMGSLLSDAYLPNGSDKPITLIPNWERAELFPAGVEPPPWGGFDAIPIQGRTVIVYLGNTGYGHQFEEVIEVARRVRDAPITFLFIGGGSRWDEIQRLAEEARVENIVMHGYIDKSLTPSVMACAHAALITLRPEALGVMSPSKLHSNLAMGLPIVYLGPAGSNVDDAIAKYDCGGSFRFDQVDAAEAFVRRLAQDQAEREKLSANARHAFDSAYCDTQTLRQFDNVFGQLSG